MGDFIYYFLVASTLIMGLLASWVDWQATGAGLNLSKDNDYLSSNDYFIISPLSSVFGSFSMTGKLKSSSSNLQSSSEGNSEGD